MNETPDAAAIFAPIWRRKWLILIVAVVVGAAAYEYYKHKPRVFSATTQLYLGSASEEAVVGEKGHKAVSSTELENQAALMTSNLIIGPVTKSLLKQHNRTAKVASRGKVSTKAKSKGDFLTVTTEAHSARAAAELANVVAHTYITRRTVTHERDVRAAIAIARRQLRRIEAESAPLPEESSTKPAKGSKTSKGSSARAPGGVQSAGLTLQIASLTTKINQFEAQLGVSQVQLVASAQARKARLLGPNPKKNAIFGFILALVLASIAAYALSRFDRRLRSMADIESTFGLPILTALPKVSRPIIRREGTVRVSVRLLEPSRRLQTVLASSSLNGAEPAVRPRSILFLGGDAGDGTSTVVSTLGLAQRDSGERVAVLDADLRAPSQASLLGVDGPHSLSDVLAGDAPLDSALRVVGSVGERLDASSEMQADGGHTARSGRLVVLANDDPFANPPALLSAARIDGLLRSLCADFDSVYIDAPPLLEFGDAIPLMRVVDAIVIVTRVGRVRKNHAERLVQTVREPGVALALGIVANGASGGEIKQYGYSTGSPSMLRRLSPLAR